MVYSPGGRGWRRGGFGGADCPFAWRLRWPVKGLALLAALHLG
ncbi:MAG: hypothetical protein M5U34_05030 [Chloroflexi bacterium]|nr:hypothetical protein [Chloroflexota bacterium]